MRIRCLLAAVAITVTAGLTGCTAAETPAPTTTASAPAPDALVAVVAEVEPSVVTIRTGDGLGSGVVYREDGVIVTNAHVVGSQRQVLVAFADGTEMTGRIVAVDEVTDLAVVHVDRSGLPAVTIRHELPRPGETALAIGSPLGFENTVTRGIISAVGRQLPASGGQARPLVDLLQTDAPISPGNSGGALIDAHGKLVGINEAYLPPATGAVSLGFAIPSSTVVEVVNQLLADGRVAHPYLGVAITTVTPAAAEALDMKVPAGALVRRVEPGGPAAKAGLRPGDVIIKFNDTTIATVGDVYRQLRPLKPGDTITLTVSRSGSVLQLPMTLGTLSS